MSPTDARFFISAAILVGAVALIATWLPTDRALGVDAMLTLRDG